MSLTPQEPYLAADLDYNNSESRVCREHADPALQDVALTSTAVESWERYDTVFVGYPSVGRQRMACQRLCEGK